MYRYSYCRSIRDCALSPAQNVISLLSRRNEEPQSACQ